jgi:mycoredoxin-dependent peroxiredoxin
MTSGSTTLSPSEPLAVGAPAPDFTLADQHGESVTLSESGALGRNVLLVFYPFAFTGTCTGELAAMRDRLGELRNESTDLIGVSCDPMFSLRVFAEQQQLEFPLLSDFWPHGAASSAFGVFEASRGCAIRGTFLIDPAGVVAWRVINGIPYARSVDDYVAAIAELNER